MHRCIELARLGAPAAFPNPLVGSILVHNNTIIAEGWHRQFGGAHAEVNTLTQIHDENILQNSTLYVNLEPCSHFGKTPPCSHLIVDKKIPRIAIGMLDPNSVVNGTGISILKKNNIEVIENILLNECAEVNRYFIINQKKNRPYIILKWAETADGFMAAKNKERIQISGAESQILLHKWRSEIQAILVGKNTYYFDNPQLNARCWNDSKPIKFTIDSEMTNNYQWVSDWNIITRKQIEIPNNTTITTENTKDIKAITQKLYVNHNVGSILVEGGRELLESFLTADFFDEIRIIKSKKTKLFSGIESPKADVPLEIIQEFRADTVFSYKKPAL